MQCILLLTWFKCLNLKQKNQILKRKIRFAEIGRIKCFFRFELFSAFKSCQFICNNLYLRSTFASHNGSRDMFTVYKSSDISIIHLNPDFLFYLGVYHIVIVPWIYFSLQYTMRLRNIQLRMDLIFCARRSQVS